MEKQKSVFEVLNAIDCKEHLETKKQGSVTLSYLSWAWAWQIAKTHFPDAFFTIYETPAGVPYFTDGRTCWVKTGVTIQGQELIEYLPIMDYTNKSIPLERVTSWDMNKAIQRSLTKALARHGLGLYVYAGEDLPEPPANEAPARNTAKKGAQSASAGTSAQQPGEPSQTGRKPVTPEVWRKTVEAHALGKMAGDITVRQWYIDTYTPTEKQLAQFDKAVVQYKINNNLK